MAKDELILVLYAHRHFGWKYALFAAERTESGSMRILGSPDAAQEKTQGTAPELIELIRRVHDTSDQALMKLYSRKKSITEFYKELTEETLERFIRPRLERANYKITQLARRIDIPAYVRTDLSNNTLFVQNEIKVLSEATACLFNFVKDEQGLRYFISLTNAGKEIALQGKQAIVLSDKPSVVFFDKEIHTIENIDSKKLLPFLTKEYVSVPAASEKMYIENFVTKALLEYNVRIEGIPFRQIDPPHKARLTLEQDLNQNYVLLLSFVYNKERIFLPEDKTQKIITLKEEEGQTAIEWYVRDAGWEKRLIDILLREGLQKEGVNRYAAPPKEDPYRLIEWLYAKKEILQTYFELEQSGEQEYYIGPVVKESDLEEKIDWFEVNITVVAGAFRIPFSRFRKHILEGRKEYLLPDKTILLLPDEWFVQYGDMFRFAREKNDRLQLGKIHVGLIASALMEEVPADKQERLRELLQVPVKPPPLPTQLKTELRPYQKEGFYWLSHLYKHNFGGCLADDMGLGKTLQMITLIQSVYAEAGRAEEKPGGGQLSLFDAFNSALPASLVVVPTSLLHNWKNELRRFAPELRVFVYAGANRLRSKTIGEIFNRFEVVVTSYGTMRNDIEFLVDYPFQMIILDESQFIKNPSSVSYKAAKQLQSDHRFVLTGTPVENSLEDLWAQFHFINEGLLGSLASFKKEYIQKIVKEKNEEREKRLRQMIAPFMLRRTKEEVTPELPPLLQEVVYCDMTDEQEEIYNEEKNRIRNTLLKAKEDLQQRQNTFIALEGLNKLRQLANHPLMIDTDYAGDSGKFEQIILFFENLKASGHKVLIFSSYVKHLKLLAEKFDRERWKYAMLTGETIKREEEIQRFTNNRDVHCFFISLKAGATGLNLTAADYVFVIDPWWNPAAEMQALSRAHRIGQEKPVIAFRFISTATVEEKILHLQETKTALFETFVQNNNPLASLGWEDIEELLSVS
ncbi:DEAD/DEAH box helicase [Parabacteroides sp. OttesenSCG-928-G06]|nr:DEAD/DEAH box helicase [Parabacteroides sp. OttesenSCG-928-G06]